MLSNTYDNLKAIRFGGELLPNWAQLLDVAAQLCPVSEETRRWFSRFSEYSGVEDARTVVKHCQTLRASLLDNYELIIDAEFPRNSQGDQSVRIFGGWLYALDTMIMAAGTRVTCLWIVQGTDDEPLGKPDTGDTASLRRV